MKYSYNYILSLFKSAAQDIPEFYPEWVKQHPKIKDVPHLSKLEKKIPIDDYRESIQFRLSLIEDSQAKSNTIHAFCNELVSTLQRFDDSISGYQNNASSDEESVLLGAFSAICSAILSSIDESKMNATIKSTPKLSQVLSTFYAIKESIVIESPKGPVNKAFHIPAGTSLISACNVLAVNFEKYTKKPAPDNIKDITKLSAFNSLAYLVSDKYKKELLNDATRPAETFDIVFTKDAASILSMSVRSDWTSCQNLLKDPDERNVKAIYSAVSPYVGMIYMTNNKDYKSRGEQMIARALVFYLEDESGDKAIINIAKVYTSHDPTLIEDTFRDSLQKHSKLPITFQTKGFFFPTEDEKEIPYFDAGVKTKTRKMLQSL
jgi:hypothetical protein